MEPRATTASLRAGFRTLLEGYAVPEGHYDELRAADGTLRPHWEAFADHAGRLNADDLARAQARVAREIHESGVTYNVYAATGGLTRPWELDVLPFILPAAEWEPLSRGLRQWARLLDAVVADLYGAQVLLGEGLLPPALVLGQPGFLRPCHGVQPPLGVFLHLVAFDVARGADGQWQVTSLRTQAPSGAGYALANRLIVSRLLRDAFRDLRVHMLAPFFRALQQLLVGGAPTEGEPPHVVLLTPGPHNETYFEHSYLARYLGFTLAEGGDLTVRDDRVFLRTLGGLRRVHAVLRRLDDDYCDPLELRSDSTLGVPGLVQAWRAGQVLVANAFGAGVVETPALYGFLPAAAERLLGQRLELPALRTRWIDEATAAAEAEAVALSHAPCWSGRGLESRAVMLRVLLVADGRGDYRVLPGGLTRIAADDHQDVSAQRGGSSKETWVLSEGPIESFSLLPGRLRSEDVAQSQGIVSSRAGENLFWLGRYAERTQNGARLLRAVLSRLPDADAFPAGLYEAFLRSCRRHGLLAEARAEEPPTPDRVERSLIAGVFDSEDRQSLAFNVEQTVRAASAVRDRISGDNWRLLSRLAQALRGEADAGAGPAEALELVDQCIVSLVAVSGLEMSHMTRDDGWRFLGLGRLVERLLFVATTAADVLSAPDPREPALLEWLLDLFDKIITYRARYMRPPEWLAVMDLLLFDRRNPRSAAFQLDKLARQARLLPEGDLDDLAATLEAILAEGRGADAPGGGLLGDPAALRQFLASCEAAALRLSDAVNLRYFSHVYAPSRATAVIW